MACLFHPPVLAVDFFLVDHFLIISGLEMVKHRLNRFPEDALLATEFKSQPQRVGSQSRSFGHPLNGPPRAPVRRLEIIVTVGPVLPFRGHDPLSRTIEHTAPNDRRFFSRRALRSIRPLAEQAVTCSQTWSTLPGIKVWNKSLGIVFPHRLEI